MCSEDGPSGQTIHASGGRYSRSQTYYNDGLKLGLEGNFEDLMAGIDTAIDMSAPTAHDPMNRQRG
jgi:hypothetical protein